MGQRNHAVNAAQAQTFCAGYPFEYRVGSLEWAANRVSVYDSEGDCKNTTALVERDLAAVRRIGVLSPHFGQLQ